MKYTIFAFTANGRRVELHVETNDLEAARKAIAEEVGTMEVYLEYVCK